MLDQYLARTLLLLKDEAFEKFNPTDLTTYINMGRGKIAGAAECIRVMGTLAVDNTTQQYTFASVNLGGLTSVQGPLAIRQASYAVGQGAKPLHTRSFPYFNTYYLSQPVPTPGPPSVWSQYGQGALGTLYVNVLDRPYTLNLDTVCYPINLSVDSDPEAIPYQFTDAVPFFAAYYAALTVGDKDRAEAMFNEYSKFMGLARSAATPSVLPGSFVQTPDPFMANRLGLQSKGQQ